MVFSNESVIRIIWPKYWSFSFSISPSKEYSGLISFRINWFDLFAVQGTLKGILQHHNLKAETLLCQQRSVWSRLWFFQWSRMDVRVGLWRKLSTKKLMLLNCGVGEDLRVPWTARRLNQSILREISPGYSLEGLMLSWNSNTLATSCGELTHWKRPWCWEGLGAGGEGDNRGWHGWMASPTQWAWVWVNSGSWWCTGRPGMLWFMGLQRVGHNWVTELNWTDWWLCHPFKVCTLSLSFLIYLKFTFIFVWLKSSGAFLGLLAKKPFSPLFLLGKTPASMIFPEFQRADSSYC